MAAMGSQQLTTSLLKHSREQTQPAGTKDTRQRPKTTRQAEWPVGSTGTSRGTAKGKAKREQPKGRRREAQGKTQDSTHSNNESEPQADAVVAINLHREVRGGGAGNQSVVDVDFAS